MQRDLTIGIMRPAGDSNLQEYYERKSTSHGIHIMKDVTEKINSAHCVKYFGLVESYWPFRVY
jgi:hypothetical protein